MFIRHTGIYVNNLNRMKDFYCKVFHMEVVVHAIESGKYINTLLGEQDVTLEIYKLKSNTGAMLELLEKKGKKERQISRKIHEPGCMHIAFTVKDVEVMYHHLQQMNIYVLSSPCISPDNKAKVCFCQDPEGNYLELVEEL